MSEIKKIYFFNPARPLRKIIAVQGTIKVCEKYTWALIPGRRCILGVSAFFTLPSAQRAQLGAVKKLIKDRSVNFMRPEIRQYTYHLHDKLERVLH